MSLCRFLTCYPDLVAIGECSAFPAGGSASSIGPGLASQLSVMMYSWEHQHTENLKKDHAAVDALDDHLGLKLCASCFFYTHALVHPAVGMIAVILRPYAILYLCLGESALCLQPQVEADLYFACHNSSQKQTGAV